MKRSFQRNEAPEAKDIWFDRLPQAFRYPSFLLKRIQPILNSEIQAFARHEETTKLT